MKADVSSEVATIDIHDMYDVRWGFHCFSTGLRRQGLGIEISFRRFLIGIRVANWYLTWGQQLRPKDDLAYSHTWAAITDDQRRHTENAGPDSGANQGACCVLPGPTKIQADAGKGTRGASLDGADRPRPVQFGVRLR